MLFIVIPGLRNRFTWRRGVFNYRVWGLWGCICVLTCVGVVGHMYMCMEMFLCLGLFPYVLNCFGMIGCVCDVWMHLNTFGYICDGCISLDTFGYVSVYVGICRYMYSWMHIVGIYSWRRIYL